ncbi:MAG: hypothetical protein MI866_04440 [Bacteroidales bacterium]|nr:hypothetical protein [Bacteroidales bacterium]
MTIKKLLKFERNIEIDCPLNSNEFVTAFKRKYVNTKKSEFKGEIERTTFKLWLDRDWFRVTDFSELNGKIYKNDSQVIIIGKVELSDTMTTMILISLIVLPIITIYQFITSGFDFELLGTFSLIFVGFIAMTNFQIYREKSNYIEEFENLFREIKEKQIKGLAPLNQERL